MAGNCWLLRHLALSTEREYILNAKLTMDLQNLSTAALSSRNLLMSVSLIHACTEYMHDPVLGSIDISVFLEACPGRKLDTHGYGLRENFSLKVNNGDNLNLRSVRVLRYSRLRTGRKLQVHRFVISLI